MTTELKRFKDAYATMTIAVYEPLIAKWYSTQGISMIADSVIARSSKKTNVSRSAMSRGGNPGGNGGNGASPNEVAFGETGMALSSLVREGSVGELVRDAPGDFLNASSPGGEREFFEAHPNVELTSREVFHGGRMEVVEDGVTDRVPAVPVIFGSGTASPALDIDIVEARTEFVAGMTETLVDLLSDRDDAIPAEELMKVVLDQNKKITGASKVTQFMPVAGEWLEMLSPIGIAHFYRQLYFYVSEGVGPIEKAFTVSPAETFEVVTETVRRQSHEETYEMGSETVSEQAIESRNVDEVSDKVATMVQRDTTAAMSANTTFTASGGVGVWNMSGSATLGGNTSMSQSSQQASELARRRLKEITKRAAERITKTFSLRVTDSTDLTTTNMERRVIENKTNQPVNYGLRRVFSRVRVKVQDIGPALVWQLYVSEPGAGLARSKFVHFADGQPIAPTGEPPAIRPRPQGGTDTGSTSATVVEDTTKPFSDPMRFYVSVVINVPPDREITAVSIDKITDLEHLAKDDYAPSPRNNAQRPGTMDKAKGTYTVDIGILPGDAYSVSVDYQYTYKPSDAIVAAWQAEYDAAQQKFKDAEAEAREKALREQFERQRALITEKSKVRSRPGADLRREERYEVMNRMISHLFRPKGSGTPGAPSPLEIELFHRYLDADAMFVYTHPSWWVPRYASPAAGFGRRDYEITSESDPARLGRSLGWAIQLDGDDRRNEYLNSPWVRVCIPIRAGREREAIAWLAQRIEGEVGYDPKSDPLKSLLTSMEKLREAQTKVAGTGPDFVGPETVVVDSTTGAPTGPLKPEDVYKVVDEFEVTVPTEGFVYDDLTVKIP